MKTEKGKIVKTGMGGFLNPPTHPEHDWSVQTDLRRRPENRGSMCLSSAVDCEWLDPATRAAARRRLDTWQRPALESVRDWVLQVLGYFRNCYNLTETDDWSVGGLTIADADPMLNADNHAGVHLIRKYYPEYMPTADDFAGAYWGSKP
jgi:hypothetical protein